jgi:hypothetical protein
MHLKEHFERVYASRQSTPRNLVGPGHHEVALGISGNRRGRNAKVVQCSFVYLKLRSEGSVTEKCSVLKPLQAWVEETTRAAVRQGPTPREETSEHERTSSQVRVDGPSLAGRPMREAERKLTSLVKFSTPNG